MMKKEKKQKQASARLRVPQLQFKTISFKLTFNCDTFHSQLKSQL